MSTILGILDTKIIVSAALAVVLYTVYGAIYRLYLSPISHFPGPKLAALTLWYEFAYDVFPLSGQYTFHLAALHAKHGPIIRINPYELHISTPQFYETLYSNARRNKWAWWVRLFGIPGGSAFTVDHNMHRLRRAAISPYFSAANIRRLQPVLDANVGRFLGRLRGLRGAGEVVRCVAAMSAFASDVIMEYSFGRSYHRLDVPDFDSANQEATHAAVSVAHLVKHFHFLLWMVKRLPRWVQKRSGTALGAIARLQHECRDHIRATKAEMEYKRQDAAHPTIFHELLNSNLPDSEKSLERLADEAQTIVVAGTETMSWTITVAMYHLLTNPVLLRKLKEELEVAIPDPNITTPLSLLENLPYLTGVIKETLRFTGASSRLQRIPLEPLIFKSGADEWVIPAGTPVGMTPLLIHRDESIFPNWREFRPERWIEDPRLDRYMTAFSKGSRSCVGMQLAYAEAYLLLSGIFRRFGSETVKFEGDEGVLALINPDPRDVEVVKDMLVPNIASGRPGVRFRVLPASV